MLNIAVCDDDMELLTIAKEQIEKNFSLYTNDFTCYAFTTPEKLLEANKKIDFFAVFLDIEMPNINGFQLAQRLLKKRPDCKIIFISSHDSLVFISLKIQPFRFIRKTHLLKEIPEAIGALYQIFLKDNEHIIVETEYRLTRIRVADIIYLESYKNYLTVHTKEKNYRFKHSLTNFVEEMGIYGFIRCHKGFAVNTNYIHSLGKGEIELSTGERIPVSRQRAPEVRETFSKVMRRLV